MASLIRRTEQENAPTAWEPFRLMRDLMSWDPFAEMFPAPRSLGSQVFMPGFEVKETSAAYLFKADLPGVDEKDLDITLSGNRLTVSGKREAEERLEGDTYYAYERSYGSFSRSFTLPDGADTDHADAELKNGVLVISIPKKAEHQPRKISLKSLADKVKGALGGREKGNA
jgi:HSP20 family protein